MNYIIHLTWRPYIPGNLNLKPITVKKKKKDLERSHAFKSHTVKLHASVYFQREVIF